MVSHSTSNQKFTIFKYSHSRRMATFVLASIILYAKSPPWQTMINISVARDTLTAPLHQGAWHQSRLRKQSNPRCIWPLAVHFLFPKQRAVHCAAKSSVDRSPFIELIWQIEERHDDVFAGCTESITQRHLDEFSLFSNWLLRTTVKALLIKRYDGRDYL